MALQTSGVLRGLGVVGVGQTSIPAPGPDDILVQVAACGICGSDMHIVQDAVLPEGTVIGHEFAGRVVAAGSNVRDLPSGTRVVANPVRSGVGLGPVPGAFAQFVAVPSAVRDDNVFVLPDSVSDEQGALVEPFSVGLHAVNVSGAKPGDRVAVFGAGTIGLCVLAALHAAGVQDVVMFDVSPKRLELARAMGATAAFNPMDGDVQEMLATQFGVFEVMLLGRTTGNADLVFDCAGVPKAFADGLEALRLGGKMVMMAMYTKPLSFDPLDTLVRELTMVASHAYADEFAQAIALMEGGVDLTPLITHRFALDDLPQAFTAQANTAEAVKVMVNMGATSKAA